MRRMIRSTGLGLAVCSVAVAAQPKKPAAPVQQVIPPKTVYWMSAATSTGLWIGVQKGPP